MIIRPTRLMDRMILPEDAFGRGRQHCADGRRPLEFLLNPYRFAAAGGDPYFSNVVSLLHMEGANGSTTFTDQIGKSWAGTSSAQITTAQFAAGAASLQLTNAGDRITTANSTDFDFGGGDFTIEANVRLSNLTGASVFRGVISKRTTFSSNNSWCLGATQNNGGFFFEFSTSGTTNAATVSVSMALSINTWYGLAVSRVGTSLYVFVNGSLAQTYAIGSSVLATVSNSTIIGTTGSSETGSFNAWIGQIDEVRVTKGVGRYSATYTPSIPYPNS